MAWSLRACITILASMLVAPLALAQDRAAQSNPAPAATTEMPREFSPAQAHEIETIVNSTHQVVLGNPQGKVTMVEFFDYNCAFCKRALPDMLELLKTDPDLKFVLKEFPVLGPGSLEAAHVAVAARMQDPSGKKYFEFHQKLLGGRGPADKARALAVAKDVGFDMARLEKDMNTDEVKVTIEENMKLADALGVNGTPSYVVGDEVVVGAVGVDELRAKIKNERN